MQLIFNTHGNDKQKQCVNYWIDQETDEIVYGGAKGGGKSFLGVSLIFMDALIYAGTHYFIARKRLIDLMNHTFPSIMEVFKLWGIKKGHWKFNGQGNYFKMHNGSRVYFLEAKFHPTDPLFERFGSMQMTRGMIEEAGEVCETAKNNLGASIGRWKNDEYKLRGKLLQTCNPSHNYLYFNYYKKYKAGTLQTEIKFIKALPQDNKKLPKGYIENLHRILSPSQKERLLFGNWEYDDDPTKLFEINAINDLWTNTVEPSPEKYLVVDAARLGGDFITCGYFEGLDLKKVYYWKKERTNVSADKIKKHASNHGVRHSHILIDEDGVGGGIVDQVENSKGFLNNGSPIQSRQQQRQSDSSEKATLTRNYGNIKAQCWFMLQELVNAGKFRISDIEPFVKERITEDLEVIKEKVSTSDGKVYIISKKEIEALLGRSTDFGDILMMRMWWELKEEISFSFVAI